MSLEKADKQGLLSGRPQTLELWGFLLFIKVRVEDGVASTDVMGCLGYFVFVTEILLLFLPYDGGDIAGVVWGNCGPVRMDHI